MNKKIKVFFGWVIYHDDLSVPVAVLPEIESDLAGLYRDSLTLREGWSAMAPEYLREDVFEAPPESADPGEMSRIKNYISSIFAEDGDEIQEISKDEATTIFEQGV